MSGRFIPPEVAAAQDAASDPQASVFVAANAGSGKTHVLVNRVIRLLLDGADPAKILCLTFTKAAAANMASGVFGTLSEWTAFDDAELDRALHTIDARPPTGARRVRARRLFAQALETPGGLKVQTIHAFCTRLLQQFPFEANVSARFAVLDEREESDLVTRVRRQVLFEASGTPSSALGRALGYASARMGDDVFADALRDVLAEREAIARWIAHAGGLDGAGAELSEALGLAPADTEETIEAEIFRKSILAATDFDSVHATLAEGSAIEAELAKQMRAAARAKGSARVAPYLEAFFTKEWTPRQRLVRQSADARLIERLHAEQTRLGPLCERWRALPVRDGTLALLTIATAVIARYRAEKQRRGQLDYDDLIARTRDLLSEAGAAWVHYKLDLGIDHVLIDEAQDTSPEQWDIICRLVAEFTAGAGARNGRRTIFAVGDEKQSIYSFQGADPHMFAEMRTHFWKAHKASGTPFRTSRFDFSFRSGANVLGAVDAVFHERSIGMSITDDEAGAPVHTALPDAAPGLVEVWPLVVPEPKDTVEGWDAPFDAEPRTSPPVRLARRIAATIKAWRTHGECLASGRPVGPGDILILVRQRGPLFEAIIRALKDGDIPVAGADRLVLTQHIAVMDLIALADALLCRNDDLALATVLKSPLFGLSEEDVFTLAWNRTGTLRAALQARAAEPAFAPAAARLAQLDADVRTSTPFAFYSALLGRGGGRARVLARLGFEAADALDEFLALALAFDTRATPTVQGFVAWMRASETEVKRDMEIGHDEVRVMTAHGAKGLESPIVFIADTTTPPAGAYPAKLLFLPPANAAPGTPDRIAWARSKDDACPALDAPRAHARKAAEDEYRRLLYVAMTRAKERLIVCGARGQKSAPQGCWYDLVCTALLPTAVEEPAPYGEGTVSRWRKVPFAPAPRQPATTAPSAARPSMPPWLTPLAVRRSAPSWLTPSAAAPSLFAGAGTHGGRARGRLVHRLMQSLPELPAAQRGEAAARFLARAAADWPVFERDALVAEVFGILDNPSFGPLFAPGSRAEAPIVGRLRRGHEELRVSGQIDRLAVDAGRILIVDYKTDRAVPRTAAEAPEAYRLQLALYGALLRRIYPGRALQAALLWTETAHLMEVSEALLDDALHHHGVRAA